MEAPRISSDKLNEILKKPGYGISTSIGGGKIRASAISSKIGRSGESRDLEPGCGYESLRAQAVAINYTGKCEVRIKFFRKRLADYSRANCEKYIIDSLTYAGIIRDDSETEIRLIDEGQEKVSTDAEERVELKLTYNEVDMDNLWVPRERYGNIGPRKQASVD